MTKKTKESKARIMPRRLFEIKPREQQKEKVVVNKEPDSLVNTFSEQHVQSEI